MNQYPTIFSDDGTGLNNPILFQQAAVCAKESDFRLILHEEDPQLSLQGVMHLGEKAKEFGYPGISSSSESTCVVRDLILSHEVGFTPHFTHLSSQQSCDALANFDRAHYTFTADTTPHHLFFNENDIDPKNACFKINPPIRSSADQKALKEAIRKGVLQCIATDHAPHSEEEKRQGFLKAPFGAIEFETAFAATYSSLIPSGWISLEQCIGLFTQYPAQILGLQTRGFIKKGYLGNICILSLENQIVSSSFYSKSNNSPFIGKNLCGKILYTIYKGKIVYDQNNKR